MKMQRLGSDNVIKKIKKKNTEGGCADKLICMRALI